ncbi:sensor histidine kinase [Brevibacterium paucivorans]|uniref:sensor histidine kinase n=1 Tax=Brevibacterium paucivorans TaxID=170994 RepID=UPI001C931B4D|nr:sensor histidine kinase [Brevibacterium paucivorans]
MGRWQGNLYVVATGLRVLLAVAAMALLGLPLWYLVAEPDRGPEQTGTLLGSGLALLGLGLPLIAVVLARLDWNGAARLNGWAVSARPAMRVHEPRTLVRPLAYSVLMLTLGGAITVLGALLIVGAIAALAGPFLVLAGDHIVIGPLTVSQLPEAVLTAVIAIGFLMLLVFSAPTLAQHHAALALQLLTRPEQRLQQDLTRTAESRARLVQAFDVERRRIERDLHDGVQPQLLSISMTLGMALATIPEDSPGRADIERAQNQARETLDALRAFVRNIHPQVLTDHGLAAAIQELADTLTIPITVDDKLSHELPSEIETNLYFCIAELLTNIGKHSHASQASIVLSERSDGTVTVTVRDNGKGGAGTNRHKTSGLDGIRDRLAALDGELILDSPLGGPTQARLIVPNPKDLNYDNN